MTPDNENLPENELPEADFNQNPTAKEVDQNNPFANIFGTESTDEGALLDNVIQQAENEKQEQREILQNDAEESLAIENNKNKILGETLYEDLQKTESVYDQERRHKAKAARAQFLLALTLLIPLISWLTFNTLLEPESKLAEILQSKNYGNIFVTTQAEAAELTEHLNDIRSDIVFTQERIDDLQNNKVLSSIEEDKVDYLKVILDVDRIAVNSLNLTDKTELAPEINKALGRLQFSSFSGGRNKKNPDQVDITVTGVVRDSKRMSFTRVTKIIEAINAADDFTGAALRTFTKSEDESGGSKSLFSLSFYYNAPEVSVDLGETIEASETNTEPQKVSGAIGQGILDSARQDSVKTIEIDVE